MNNYSVYKHTSPSGKVYIGVTGSKPEKRWNRGHGYSDNGRFSKAIKKYGWEAFTHEILLEKLAREEAYEKEAQLIAEYDSTNPQKGYNLSPGGSHPWAGMHHTEEAKAKIRKARLGRGLSPEAKAKLSLARKGWSPSPETRARMSAASKGRTSPNRGRALSDLERQRLQNLAPKKAVVNLDTGQNFPSINAAARASGLHPGAIWAVCNGKQRTHGGYHWAYKEVV